MFPFAVNGANGNRPMKAWRFRAAFNIEPYRTLTEFPTYVDETVMPSNFFSEVQNGGGDIRVTSDVMGLNEEPVEVVECNTSTNKLQLWFKIHSTSASNVTFFYIWYGNTLAVMPDADSANGSEEVWNNSGEKDYIGAYHMDESSGDLLDSSENGNDWTPNGNMPSPLASICGDGQEFEDLNDYFTAPNRMVGTANFSIEFWITTTQVAPTAAQWYQGVGLIDAEQAGLKDDWGISMIDSGKIAFGAGEFGSPDITIKSVSSVNDGNPHHIAITFNHGGGANNGTIYIDGVKDVEGTIYNHTKDDINPIMGAIRSNTALRFIGVLDEVRFSGFQDGNYYAQSWYNQNDVSDFVTLLGTV